MVPPHKGTLKTYILIKHFLSDFCHASCCEESWGLLEQQKPGYLLCGFSKQSFRWSKKWPNSRRLLSRGKNYSCIVNFKVFSPVESSKSDQEHPSKGG